MVVAKTDAVICCRCNGKSPAEDWDRLSFKSCINREMKRAYIPIFKESAFHRKSDTWYQCPICKNWMRGCNLAVDVPPSNALYKLGREPFIQLPDE